MNTNVAPSPIPVPTSPIVPPYVAASGSTLILPPGSASPVLAVNGTAATLTAGPGKATGAAFDSYAIATAVNPGDTLSLSLGGKITPLANYSGSPEFPCPQPAMNLGMLISHNVIMGWETFCPIRNWARRIRAWTPTPLSVDSAGLPTKIVGKTTGQFVAFTYSNYIDKQYVRNLFGIYYLKYDAIDTSTIVDMVGLLGTSCVAIPAMSSPGVGGIGIVKAYQAAPASGVQCVALGVTIDHPDKTPSIANLEVIPPGNPATEDDPMAPEISVVDRLKIGTRGPATLRWVDCINNTGGESNAIDPGDQPGIGLSSWYDSGRNPTATIVSIQPVPIPGNVSTLYGDPQYTDLSPFWFGPRWVAEFTTDQPHGFTTGQTATLATPSALAGTVSGVPVSLANGAMLIVFVTGQDTFVCPFYSGKIPSDPSQALNLDGPIRLPDGGGVAATVSVPGGPYLPVEFATSFTSRFDECYFWYNYPIVGSDALAASEARRIGPYLGPRNKIILELSNECWNAAYPQQQVNWTLSKLQGDGRIPLFSARRTLEIANIFRANLGLRHDDVIGVFCWQFGGLTNYIKACIAANLFPDALATAPYFATPTAWSTSLAGWSPAQIHDICRSNMSLGYTRQFADYANAINLLEAATGRRTMRLSYEFGVCNGSPAGLGAVAANNFYSHPHMRITENLGYAMCQNSGFDIISCTSFAVGIGADGTNWGYYQYQGQQPGSGDGSDGRMINPTMSTTWMPTVSPRGRAWRDWQTAALVGRD